MRYTQKGHGGTRWETPRGHRGILRDTRRRHGGTSGGDEGTRGIWRGHSEAGHAGYTGRTRGGHAGTRGGHREDTGRTRGGHREDTGGCTAGESKAEEKGGSQLRARGCRVPPVTPARPQPPCPLRGSPPSLSFPGGLPAAGSPHFPAGDPHLAQPHPRAPVSPEVATGLSGALGQAGPVAPGQHRSSPCHTIPQKSCPTFVGHAVAPGITGASPRPLRRLPEERRWLRVSFSIYFCKEAEKEREREREGVTS